MSDRLRRRCASSPPIRRISGRTTVRAAVEEGRQSTAYFEAAQFELPRAMPEAVQIWRGTSGLTVEKAALGYSWTTDRNVACWFAMRRPERHGAPLVLTAHVKRADIAFFSDERNECEVLIFDQPNSEIDGTEQEWQQGLNEFEMAKSARQRAWMKVLPTIGSVAEQSR